MISKSFLHKVKRLKIVQKIFLGYKVPTYISRNFKFPSNFELNYKDKWNYKNQFSNSYNSYSVVQNELDERLESFRKQTIPWLDSVKKLKNLRILEIGCGNGMSTIALAEQGAKVTAIDIEENLLRDAKIRCEIYELDVKFYLLNATEIDYVLSDQVFDMIIFMASLEHMTLDERLISMKKTYAMLPSGGVWCIIGTPNRLHFLDSHTSFLPFFNWLPDELAQKYLSFSSRHDYKEHLLGINDKKEKLLQFYRWGRGVSFHEIEIAIKPLNELNIISCATNFYRKRNWFYKIAKRFSSNDKYELYFTKRYPGIHGGFFQPYLDLIFQKD